MTHYAIIGGGRLARHMGHYLSLLGQPWSGWARDPASPLNTHDISNARKRLEAAIKPASHVLLLVSDKAIMPVVKKYPFLHGKILVHCAGAISLPGIAGAHPLMTFAEEMYSLEDYQRIPFMVESGYCFTELFPDLSNPSHPISVEQKALYHALCVMAGNFPQLLWREVTRKLNDELSLPAEVLQPYLAKILDNFKRAPDVALTGPLVRGDRQTIERNISALDGDPLQLLYHGFVDLYGSLADKADLEEKVS